MQTLDTLPLRHSGRVVYIDKSCSIFQRLADLGITPGTAITPLHKSILKNPIAYEIRGAVLALRKEDAKCIFIHDIKE